MIVAKVLELTGSTSYTSFADDATNPSWAKNAIASLQEKGLVSGKTGNKYDPSAASTRAEAITLILNMLNNK
ncbi:MAG: S-layer homology domain-containing protein [Candidatus Pristimantibacillus lignocellulolyticus]|uniref:S-layer homology domain-containing protein n=1 Tax=Candidatus Pristimantibacillus lignocellulolyticus TaxID=2994561 RepID=A0A9J6ZG13_9BACL|nr:MAG: S-layer homology domain-containing protein [Candidatus Pristimantibacillus lignocellulolyticus]